MTSRLEMSPVRSTIALDLTCLLIGPLSLNPRGIDRVELAYAWHFIDNWPGEFVAIIPTPWGMRAFDRPRVKRALVALEEIWREDIAPEDDAIFGRTKSFLLGKDTKPEDLHLPRSKPLLSKVRDFVRLLLKAGIAPGKPVRSLPRQTIYLNVGQLLFFRPWFSWLARRPDVLSVFMIHDLIPLEHPDHHVPLGIKLHRSIVKNTLEFAGALIVPSRLVRDSLKQPFLPANPSKGSLANKPVHVELLPVSQAFLQPAEQDPDLSNTDYFLACGAIDAHKNHVLLLQVWRDLIEHHGEEAPKLVIAGFRTVTSEPVFDFLRNNPSVRSKVIIASGLSTPALRKLMMSARALLMPSIAEGFGLPVVEALAQGTPVLASENPAMREAGEGGDVSYLSPDDRDAWKSAIESLCARGRIAERAAYIPKQWGEYFSGIESFLAGLPHESVYQNIDAEPHSLRER